MPPTYLLRRLGIANLGSAWKKSGSFAPRERQRKCREETFEAAKTRGGVATASFQLHSKVPAAPVLKEANVKRESTLTPRMVPSTTCHVMTSSLYYATMPMPTGSDQCAQVSPFVAVTTQGWQNDESLIHTVVNKIANLRGWIAFSCSICKRQQHAEPGTRTTKSSISLNFWLERTWQRRPSAISDSLEEKPPSVRPARQQTSAPATACARFRCAGNQSPVPALFAQTAAPL